jgi:hypothetical protein
MFPHLFPALRRVVAVTLSVVFLFSAVRNGMATPPPPEEVEPEPYPGTDVYPAQIWVGDEQAMQVLYDLGVDIDFVRSLNAGMAYPRLVRVYVTPIEANRLRSMGLEAMPIPNESVRAWALYGPGNGVQQPSTWPTFAQITTRLQTIAGNYPQIVRLVSIGQSVQGRDLWCLKITDAPDVAEDEPEVKFSSSIHGDEPTGMEMTLRLAELLTSNYVATTPDPELKALVDGLEIWLCPLSNPDGYVNNTRYNANGEDLNRNFPDPIQDGEESPEGREIETQMMMQFGAQHRFVLGVNYHGGAQVVNYPWDGWTSSQQLPPDNAEFINFSTGYAQRNDDIWNFPNPARIIQGADWYVVYGGLQDWSYYWHGEQHVTIEVSNTKAPSYSQMNTFWEHNRAAMVWWLERAWVGVRGLVTDGQTGMPLDAQVWVERTVDIPGRTDAAVGDYHRLLLPGTYTLRAEAVCYVPQTVQVVVNEGAATVQNFALQPAAQTQLSGSVTDATSGSPLLAQITLKETGQTLETDPVTGAYSLNVCDGTYTVEVDALHYSRQTRVVAVSGGQMVEDFALERTPCTLLVDDDGSSTYETYYQAALDANDAAFDLWRVSQSGSPSLEVLKDYGRVIWLTGATSSNTLTAADRAALGAYLDQGGRLFVTGQDIGYDLHNDPFYANYLHARYDADDTNLSSLTGAGYLDGISVSLGGDGVAQSWPSDIEPLNGAETALRWSGTTYHAGGISFTDSVYRMVYFSFGFEGISTAAKRAEVMGRTLEYLGGCEQPLPPPQAAFVSSITRGIAPLEVVFQNQTIGTYTTTVWDFDDGSGSTDENPVHIYTRPGVYTVRLTVDGPAGRDEAQAVIEVEYGLFLPGVLR